MMVSARPQSFVSRAKWPCLVASLLLLRVAGAVAATDSQPLVSGPELGLPSMWRVLFGFILVVVVAVGAVALLRRLRPWVPLPGRNSDTDVLLLSLFIF